MKRFVVPSVFLSLLCLSIVPAHAQERGQTGITMALPESIGLIWHASDSVAVRPEVDFGFISTKSDTPVGEVEGDGHTFLIGASVLFYTGQLDEVRTYVAPRLAYATTSYGDDDSVGGVSIAGSFGAQYTPVRRFSIFAEVGLEYNRRATSFDAAIGEFDASSTEIGPRTSIGVVLYLGG